jgi:hypothetical protein
MSRRIVAMSFVLVVLASIRHLGGRSVALG